MVGRYTIGSNEVQCEVLYAVGRCCVILSGRCVMLGKAGEALECGSWRPGAVPGARLPCYRGTGGRCPGAALLLLLLLLLLHPQQPTTCPLFTLPTCSWAFCSRVAQLPSPSPAHNLPQPRLTLVRSHCWLLWGKTTTPVQRTLSHRSSTRLASAWMINMTPSSFSVWR